MTDEIGKTIDAHIEREGQFSADGEDDGCCQQPEYGPVEILAFLIKGCHGA